MTLGQDIGRKLVKWGGMDGVRGGKAKFHEKLSITGLMVGEVDSH